MAQYSKVHRVWASGMLTIQMLLTFHLFLSSFMGSRHTITETAELGPEHAAPGRKVIYILFDALREDYIEWPEERQPNLKSDESYAYTMKKASLFRRLIEEQPENAFLVPLKSEMPTITVVRIKTFLSGVLNSVSDFLEALDQSQFKEDTILFQLHQKLKEKARINFYGEDIWVKNFGRFFTKQVSLPDQNVFELDLNDDSAAANMFADLDQGSDFDFLIAHLIGLDHAGHSYRTKHPFLEKKLLDVEAIVETVIEKMDNMTTLVVFGDHGMAESGGHGGSSEIEMRTVLFAYQKTPFPMAQKYRQMRDHFDVLDSMVKQADIAPIGSQLLNVPTPFSNIGNMHPFFNPSDDLDGAIDAMRGNIEQVYRYVEKYCLETNSDWCAEELASLESDLVQMDLQEPLTDQARIKKLETMAVVMNNRYEELKVKWIDKNQVAMLVGIVMAFNTFFFHVFANFSWGTFEQGKGGLVGVTVCALAYLGALIKLYKLWVAAIICLAVSFGQSWRPRSEFLGIANEQICIILERSQTRKLVQRSYYVILMTLWQSLNHSDLLIQEQDYVYELLILICLGALWLTKPAHQRLKDLPKIALIFVSMRIAYFNDTEQSQNKPLEAPLLEARTWFQTKGKHFMFIWMIALFFLERRIAKFCNFDALFRAQAHTLTALHIFYQLLVVRNNLALESQGTEITHEAKVLQEEREAAASYLGFTIYAAVALSLFFTIAQSRFRSDSSLEDLSIRCGLLFAKACMLLGGKCGSLVYACFILQTYAFALMLDQRREDYPRLGHKIYVVYSFLTTGLCFMRTGHRERMSSIKVGQVCPGNTGCQQWVHHLLTLCDLTFPYILGLLLLPLIVKSRILSAILIVKKRILSTSGLEKQDKAVRTKVPPKQVEMRQIQFQALGQDPDNCAQEPGQESEFIGEMKHGISLYLLPVLQAAIINCIFVYIVQDELIFTDRVAPKFVFDALKSLIALAFYLFWTLCS